MAFAEASAASRKRADYYRELSVGAVKANSRGGSRNPIAESVASSFGIGSVNAQDHSLHTEQYRNFRGLPYTAIRPVCTRIAGQQIHVASVNDRLAMAATRAAANGELFGLKQSLPSCYKALGDDLDPIPNHPLLQAFETPNDLMVQWQLFWVTVASMEVTGKTFWWIDHNSEGLLPSIWQIPSNWIKPVHRGQQLLAEWHIQPTGFAEPITVPGNQIAYFNYPDPADPLGSISPLQAHARAIMTDDSLQESQYQSMKNGIRPSMILKAGRLPDLTGTQGPGQRPVLTPAQRSQLIGAIKMAYSGTHRHGEPLIVDGLIDEAIPWMRSGAEMDWLNSGNQTRDRIFQGIGTNPIVAGMVEGANRASSVVADENFVRNKVNPLITLMSQVMTRRLGPLFARPGERLIVWIEEAKARDSELNQRRWEAAIDSRVVTPNEYRTHVLNLEPREGLDEWPEPAAVPTGGQGKLGGEDDSEFAAGDKDRANRRQNSTRRQAGKSAAGLMKKSADKALTPQRKATTARESLGDDGQVKMWQQQHEAATAALAGKLTTLFQQQSEAIIAALGVLVAGDAKVFEKHSAKSLAEKVFDPAGWTSQLRDVARKPLQDAAKMAAAAQLSVANLDLPAISALKLVQADVDSLDGFVDGVLNSNYWADIHRVTAKRLADAFELAYAGRGTPEIKQLTPHVRAVLTSKEATDRAANIAANEQTAMVNHGTLYGLGLLAKRGLVSGKKWLPATSSNHRPSHSKLAGQVAGLDQDFLVGGHAAPYPGYHGLPAEERIGCRCAIVAV